MALSGAPVVVVTDRGIPVINNQKGAPMTVAANSIGLAVQIVTANGIPVTLLKPDGSAYP